MAATPLAPTTGLPDLKVLFNSVKEVYYSPSELLTSSFATTLSGIIELPVLEDSINFDMGNPDITPIKLTTGIVWTSKATKGDPDISMQVASVAGTINNLFMTADSVHTIADIEGFIGGEDYTGVAFKTDVKKVTGAIILPSEDKQTVIVLPAVEMYGALVAADGDNPAYFNVNVTPVQNSQGIDLMILTKDA